jgi:hypothetical protein
MRFGSVQNGPVSRRLVTWFGIGAMLALWVACSSAGSRSMRATTVPLPQISEPSFVHTFNARGWQYLWTKGPGTSKHQCVAVRPGWTGARSGSFSAGNFAAFISGWDGTANYAKLAYIPRYPDQKQPLTVAVMPLDGQPAGAFAGLAGVSFVWGYDGIPFYATGTFLPHRGLWRLVATAGPNWGCFDLRI